MNNRKIIAFMLSLTILCPVGSIAIQNTANTIVASATSQTPTDESYFTINSDGTLMKYTGTATNVVIPSTINGINVTSIGYPAFRNNSSIKSIVIPKGVTYIGGNAFYNCVSLTSVEIPEGITKIEFYTFRNCKSLTSIKIPQGVLSINDSAFYDCSSLRTVEIPNSVKKISVSAFENCTALTSIEIPEGVTSIDGSAFKYCTSLTNVKISNSVTSIGSFTFYGCTALKSIKIPNSVTSIDSYAFYNCQALTSMEIPSSVTSIGEFAFNNCTSLASIEIPNSVTSIGNSAFNSCTALTSIEIPNSVIKVGENAFDYCDNLQTIIVDKLKSDCTEFNLPKEPPTLKIYYNVKVSRNCSNLTSSNLADEISSYYDYTTTLTANDDYTLPSDITVKVGDTILKDGYTFENGVLTISKNKITDDITIEATGKLKEYSVTSNLTNIKSNGTDKVSHGKEYKATLTADDGYNLPSDITIKVGDTVLKDGYTFVDGVLTISGEKVTGNITINAIGNKKHTSIDLLRLKKHILGISTIEDITSLDLNNDETLNILDVIAFKNKLLNE